MPNNSELGVLPQLETKPSIEAKKPFTFDFAAAKRIVEPSRSFLQNFPNGIFAEPAVILHVYNFLNENPNADDNALEAELNTLKPMAEAEAAAALDPDLPSIGIEVEFPETLFPSGKLLEELEYLDQGRRLDPHLPSKEDYLGMIELLESQGFTVAKDGGQSTEFSFPPSNSAAVQNRMLYELRRLGIIPVDDQFASLHISLGIPWENSPYISGMSGYVNENNRTYKDRYRVLTAISDLQTYAFVPAGRVRTRNHALHAVDPAKEVVPVADLKAETPKGVVLRAEFRTGRVHKAKTYRQMVELQRLGVLVATKDKKLKDVRKNLQGDVGSLLSDYSLESNLPANDQDRAADAIESAWQIKLENKAKGENTPNLIDDARILMKTYAQKVVDHQKQPKTQRQRLTSFLRFPNLK